MCSYLLTGDDKTRSTIAAVLANNSDNVAESFIHGHVFLMHVTYREEFITLLFLTPYPPIRDDARARFYAE